MNKAIYRYFCTVLLLSLLISSAVLVFILSRQMLENTKEEMLYSIKMVDYHLQGADDLVSEVQTINDNTYTEDTRLTIIDTEGNVIADSEKNSTESHQDREEVQEALETGEGSAIRFSSTTNKRLLYVAYYNDNYIVRVSIPYQGMYSNAMNLVLPLGTSVIISLGIAAWVAKKLSNRLAQPAIAISKEVQNMNQRQQMHFETYPYEEYNHVAKALLQQEEVIQDTLNRLQFEKIRVSNVIDQMNEGFILLDKDLDILMVNKQAKEIVNRGMKKHTKLTEYIFDEEMIEAIRNLDKKHRVDYKRDQRIYSCFITNVDYGVTLLFVDVTQSRNAAKMRQEFFANVSHELKTPMTAIKGYSELLEADMISEPKMRKEAFSKIQKEVNTMTRLVNDILMISRLESNDVQVERVEIQMPAQVQEVVDSLYYEANKKNITIHTHCEDVSYLCDPQHMHQILNNLISNAIKYNVEAGSITVRVFRNDKHLLIEVQDTGIGISREDQEHVFERFYRCDKARSRSIGGTGLGLSIVKHIVQYYKGSIQLFSELYKGTCITVVLPITNNHK